MLVLEFVGLLAVMKLLVPESEQEDSIGLLLVVAELVLVLPTWHLL